MLQLLVDMGVPQSSETTLHCDNQTAIAISKDPVQHGRTKHIDMCFHFIHSLIADGVIKVIHCNTHDNLADVTKALLGPKHEELRHRLGILDF